MFPLESSTENDIKMDLEAQMLLAKKADHLGFASLFVRDSPLYDPNLGNGSAYLRSSYISRVRSCAYSCTGKSRI